LEKELETITKVIYDGISNYGRMKGSSDSLPKKTTVVLEKNLLKNNCLRTPEVNQRQRTNNWEPDSALSFIIYIQSQCPR
jgi:hypothetical protein